ncbi:MAG: hypothetical protein Q8P45_01535 [Candidatus Harrisonbacteria bacterium]|nr:hypothetical protein [Candidatus Harrisonbacteria bacterium]
MANGHAPQRARYWDQERNEREQIRREKTVRRRKKRYFRRWLRRNENRPLTHSRRKGLAAEQKVIAAFTNGERPDWYSAIRRADPEEDYHGVDIILYSPWGAHCIQVKSSLEYARDWERRRRHHDGIKVIVVKPQDSLEVVRQKVARALRLQLTAASY